MDTTINECTFIRWLFANPTTAISALAAIAAAFSAYFSFRATELSKIALQGTTAQNIRINYSSREMYESMRYIQIDRDCYQDATNERYKNLEKEKSPSFQIYDMHRRRIVHHFHNIRILSNAGILDKDTVIKIIMPEEVEFLFKYIEPLEKLKSIYEPATFDFFHKLFPTIKRNQ
ncbi:MAG: hypothetical protein PHU49_03670 [Syntrophorhabdaceae bacterium]|nr:hypothetical protein [Syntrophorhabdaceae bacterium]MDD5243094.1 hypothetical protein [Syntrophorhabdaceae bacterium]